MKHIKTFFYIILLIQSIALHANTFDIDGKHWTDLEHCSVVQKNAFIAVHAYDVVISNAHSEHFDHRVHTIAVANDIDNSQDTYQLQNGILWYTNKDSSLPCNISVGFNLASFLIYGIPYIRRWFHKVEPNWAPLNPRIEYQMSNWNAEDFRRYFSHTLCYEYNRSQLEAIIRMYALYQFEYFQDFLATTPQALPIIEKIRDQIRLDEPFKQELANAPKKMRQRLYNALRSIHPRLQEYVQQENVRAQEQVRNLQAMCLHHNFTAQLQKALNTNQYAEHHTDRIQKRKNALQQSPHIQSHRYIVTEPVRTLLAQHNLSVKHYTQCNGLPFQQVLHGECIALMHEVANHKENFGNLGPSIVDITDIGREYNHGNNLLKSMTVIDYAWALLDLGKAALHVAQPYATAVVLGVADSLQNTAHMIAHPIETVQDIGCAIGTVAYYTGKLIIDAHAIETDMLLHELGHTPERFDYAQKMAHEITTWAATKKPEDIVRSSATIISDFAFMPKLLGIIGRMGNRAVAKGRDYIKKLPSMLARSQREAAGVGAIEAAEAEAFTQAAEEVYEARSSAMQSSTVTPPRGGGTSFIPPIIETVEDAIGYMKTIAEDLALYSPTAMQDCAAMCDKIRSEIPAGATFGTEEFINYLAKLEIESAIIKKINGKLRKGYGPIANHTIRLREKHALGMDIDWRNLNPHLDGLHHDYLGALEGSGIIELIDKIESPIGAYKAEVIWNGRKFKQKSFFPKGWLRQQVIEKILEAFDDCVKRNVFLDFSKKKRCTIRGFTSDMLEIEMIINSNGEIITAYPII